MGVLWRLQLHVIMGRMSGAGYLIMVFFKIASGRNKLNIPNNNMFIFFSFFLTCTLCLFFEFKLIFYKIF